MLNWTANRSINLSLSALLLSGSLSYSNMGTSQTKTVISQDISSLLDPQNPTRDLRFVGAVPVKVSDEIKRGLIGDWRVGSISLNPRGSSSTPIGYSLRMTVSGPAQISLESCLPNQSCSPLSAESPRSNALAFAVEGLTWDLEFYPPICGEAAFCILNIPSWALEQRRQSSSVQSLSDLLIVVQTKDEIHLLRDLPKASAWLSYSVGEGSTLDQLGQLQRLESTGDNLISLHGDLGTAIVDLLNDRVLSISASGIGLSSAGIGGIGNGSPQSVLTPANTGTLLSVSAKAVVWERGYAQIDLDQQNWTKIVIGDFQSFDSPIRIASPNADGTFSVLACHSRVLKRSVLKIGEGLSVESNVSGSSYCATNSNLILTEGDIYIDRSAGGVSSLTKSGTAKNTSLSKSGLTVLSAIRGQVLAKEQEGAECRLVHYTQHATVSESFRSFGIEAPCAGTYSFSVGNDSAALCVLQGTTLKIQRVDGLK